MLKRAAFIPPSNPILRAEPPEGDGWLHEIKFDGYRAQLHKDGDEVTLYSKNGKDFTARFKDIAKAVALLPVKRAIIDAEIVASDDEGRPDFRALHSCAKQGLCAWCFDLLVLEDRDLIKEPLTSRRKLLQKLFKRGGYDCLKFSESFDDPLALLRQAAVMGLEGVVSKRADQPYQSGTNRSWVKVKTHDWRESNKDRGELFDKKKAASLR
jgi:bifunctional non-homologous end joining protein LigD